MIYSKFEKCIVEWILTLVFKLLNTLLLLNLVTRTSLVSYFLRKHDSCREMSKARVVNVCVTTNIPPQKIFAIHERSYDTRKEF